MARSDTDVPAGARLRPRQLSARAAVDRLALAACQALLAGRTRGRLQLTLPSGAATVIEGGTAGAEARLRLASYAALLRSLRRGSIGFAEAYVNGECDSDNPVALVAYFIDNMALLKRIGRGLFRVRASDRRYHAQRANTRSGALANISAHYDLGNAFYACWLDPTMTYSAAIFGEAAPTLEAAQDAKYAKILACLDLSPGQSILEIGCGWGAMALRAARAGGRVTGLTLSSEQAAWARACAGQSGLADRIDIRLEDYRDAKGAFDRIVSIEMIEAVGEQHWDTYFQVLAQRLKPGGIAVLQAITIAEDLFPSYRQKPDFIQRFIFPGGMLPTRRLIEEHARRAGFEIETIETFGASYARTLAEWRARFETSWPRIAELGYDDRFRRMWTYYLAYCEAGFERGTIDVGIYRLRPRSCPEILEVPQAARASGFSSHSPGA